MMRRVALLTLAALGAASLAACGESFVAAKYAGQRLGPAPAAPAAPAFAARNQSGRLVRLSQFRGRAVLLTFVYTRCDDV